MCEKCGYVPETDTALFTVIVFEDQNGEFGLHSPDLAEGVELTPWRLMAIIKGLMAIEEVRRKLIKDILLLIAARKN